MIFKKTLQYLFILCGLSVSVFAVSAVDDYSTGTGTGNTVTLDVLSNDIVDENGIDTTTVNLSSSNVGTDSDGDGDIDSVIISGEGTWIVNESGDVTFTPEAGFTGDPTPINYTVKDNVGLVSNEATIMIDYVYALSISIDGILPIIEESGDIYAPYKLSVTLSEPLPEGYYVAVNFDNMQGDWLLQNDPGGHVILDNNTSSTYWKNIVLNYPGLRSFRAGIFDAGGTLVGDYSEGNVCTLDSCFHAQSYDSGYSDPALSGKASRLVRGVDMTNGNFNFHSIDLTVTGKGPDFTLVRAYNSYVNGWSFNLDANISYAEGSFDRVVRIGPREDGRYQYYYKDMLNSDQWSTLTVGNFDQLVEESDGSFTLYTKGNLYYKFENPSSSYAGRLRSIHDRDGNGLLFSHTSNRITGATDASGRNYTVTRDINGNIIRVADFTGRDVEYSWNSDQRITTYTNPRGLLSTYTYNANKRLETIKDPKNNTLYTLSYYTTPENAFRVQTITDASGSVWEYLYGSLSANDTYTNGVIRPSVNGINHNMAFIVDRYKTKILETIDAENAGDYRTKKTYKQASSRQRIADLALAATIQQPSGSQTAISYYDNTQGNPDTITDALSRNTGMTWASIAGQTNLTPLSTLTQPGVAQPTQYQNFTSSGKAQTVTDPLGNSVNLTYDASGLTTQVTDALNYATAIAYDAQGRPTQITDALNQTTTMVYDTLGRITSSTNARNYTTSYTYDANGNVKTVTDPENGTTTYTYDDSDNLISIKDPRNNTMTFGYDTMNRKTSESYTVAGIVHTRSIAYDAMGRISTVTDEESHTSQTRYDARSKVTSQLNPLSQSTTYTYDANGNVKTISDAEGRRFTYEYDALDRTTKITDSLGLYEQYTYNTQGLLSGKRDKKSRWTYYEYDALGQMTKVTQPDGDFTRASYDPNGNLSSTTDRKGQVTTYTYDKINRLTQLKDAMNRTWGFTYDANGNLLTRTTPTGKVTTYTYDKLDRVTRVQYPDQSVTYTYDANGNRLSMTDAIGTTSYIYDELNRLTQVTNAYGQIVKYTYNKSGTLKELTYPGNKKISYGYDAANRLGSLTDWLGDTTSYTRDNSGMTTQVTYGNGTTVNKVYDAAGRLKELYNKKGTSVISSHIMSLDNVGNPTSIQADLPLLPGNLGREAEILYDSSNRMTSVDGKSILHDSDGRITADQSHTDPIEYAYNAQDLITSMKVNAVTTDQYTYDGDGRRIAKTSSGQSTRYVLDPTGGDLYSVLVETDGANAALHYYVYGEGLVSQISGTNHHYYHFDQSGNTLALTSDDGNITDKYAYEPFGATTVEGTTYNPFRFVGQYGVMDDGNGLHHMRARYYRTDMRRFVSLDALYGKVTDPMTLNRYQYVSGNPMVGVDPSGYETAIQRYDNMFERAARARANDMAFCKGAWECTVANAKGIGYSLTSAVSDAFVRSAVAVTSNVMERDGVSEIISWDGLDVAVSLAPAGKYISRGGKYLIKKSPVKYKDVKNTYKSTRNIIKSNVKQTFKKIKKLSTKYMSKAEREIAKERIKIQKDINKQFINLYKISDDFKLSTIFGNLSGLMGEE